MYNACYKIRRCGNDCQWNNYLTAKKTNWIGFKQVIENHTIYSVLYHSSIKALLVESDYEKVVNGLIHLSKFTLVCIVDILVLLSFYKINKLIYPIKGLKH